MPWKTITVPKTVYLPTSDGSQAFKDTGSKVSPTDILEIDTAPGSHAIKINGVTFQMLIPSKNLRIDPNNCIIIDKPTPVILSPGGEGHASVGRIGTTTIVARNNAKSPYPAKNDLFDDQPEEEATLKSLHQAKLDEALQENAIVQTITLKDGTTAQVLIDPNTGRHCSAPFRTYSGIGTNKTETARFFAEQEQNARVVLASAPVPPVSSHPKQEPTPPTAPAKAASTGNPIFDGFLNTYLGSEGFPIGQVTYLQITPELLQTLLDKMTVPPTQVVHNLKEVFSTLYTASASQPLLAAILDPESMDPSIETRLALADFLAPLLEATKALGKRALLIISPPWNDDITPSLLRHLVPHHIRITPHAQDPKFITCCVQQGPSTGTASWPL